MKSFRFCVHTRALIASDAVNLPPNFFNNVTGAVCAIAPKTRRKSAVGRMGAAHPPQRLQQATTADDIRHPHHVFCRSRKLSPHPEEPRSGVSKDECEAHGSRRAPSARSSP